MRSMVVAASVLAATWLSSPPALAQEPAAPNPPASTVERQRAVPRVREANTSNQPQSEGRVQSEARERSSVRKPPAQPTARVNDDGARTREVVNPVAQAQAANAEQQGGVRRPRSSGEGGRSGSSGGGDQRGAVRREPRGSSADGQGRPQSRADRAIPRADAPRPRPSRPVYVYRSNPWPWYYDPWYGYGHYGGFGIGYAHYSPWSWYGPGWYPRYGGGAPYGYDGKVRLEIKPKDAEVLVDGYYAGIVDDFDGTFQGLRLEPGGYKIEVRKPGFETLTYDVRVQPDRTIRFHAEMRATP